MNGKIHEMDRTQSELVVFFITEGFGGLGEPVPPLLEAHFVALLTVLNGFLFQRRLVHLSPGIIVAPEDDRRRTGRCAIPCRKPRSGFDPSYHSSPRGRRAWRAFTFS